MKNKILKSLTLLLLALYPIACFSEDSDSAFKKTVAEFEQIRDEEHQFLIFILTTEAIEKKPQSEFTQTYQKSIAKFKKKYGNLTIQEAQRKKFALSEKLYELSVTLIEEYNYHPAYYQVFGWLNIAYLDGTNIPSESTFYGMNLLNEIINGKRNVDNKMIAEAYESMGLFHSQGKLARKDEEKALEYFGIACDKGLTSACGFYDEQKSSLEFKKRYNP